MTWRSFVTEAGSLEQAALIVGYAVLVASLIMAVLCQAAWLVSRRYVRKYRVRQDLQRVREDAYRERQMAIDRDAYRRIG